MKVLIEGYGYSYDLIEPIIGSVHHSLDGKVYPSKVGYCYNSKLKDCVFILPKVLLENSSGQDLVFGKYTPESILLDTCSLVSQNEQHFLYEFAIWIYRTIKVFALDRPQSSIVQSHQSIGKVGKGEKDGTLLDIALSLSCFGQEHHDFILFAIRNQYSGFDKIDWHRTISVGKAFVSNGKPIYMHPCNKKRVVDLDEELILLYYSILNYLKELFGFDVVIPANFRLITGTAFSRYLEGYGCVRLRQIRYKYFSDTTQRLWSLCYAFFERTNTIYCDPRYEEYLFVSNFEIVFEAIIDQLVGSAESELSELREQADGKRIDHIYPYKGLLSREDVLYIGDSKYYKRNVQLGKESVYKQYTYAKNLIQWNIDRLLDGKVGCIGSWKYRPLRNAETEGYDVVPNFFISAKVNKQLDYHEQLDWTQNKEQSYCMRQYENCLFDRDTLLLAHFDVNFLHVVSLYARANKKQQLCWKEKVREQFRKSILSMLNERYDFYWITPKENVAVSQFIHIHFHDLVGKIYSPQKDVYVLALEKAHRFRTENERILQIIDLGFTRCKRELF